MERVFYSRKRARHFICINHSLIQYIFLEPLQCANHILETSKQGRYGFCPHKTFGIFLGGWGAKVDHLESRFCVYAILEASFTKKKLHVEKLPSASVGSWSWSFIDFMGHLPLGSSCWRSPPSLSTWVSPNQSVTNHLKFTSFGTQQHFSFPKIFNKCKLF